MKLGTKLRLLTIYAKYRKYLQFIVPAAVVLIGLAGFLWWR